MALLPNPSSRTFQNGAADNNKAGCGTGLEYV
jgi:hypothetical protein